MKALYFRVGDYKLLLNVEYVVEIFEKNNALATQQDILAFKEDVALWRNVTAQYVDLRGLLQCTQAQDLDDQAMLKSADTIVVCDVNGRRLLLIVDEIFSLEDLDGKEKLPLRINEMHLESMVEALISFDQKEPMCMVMNNPASLL